MGKQKDKIWYLENFDLFRELPKKAMMELMDITIMQSCIKKEIIYFEHSKSDNVYLCKEGRVKISRTSPKGKETTLYVIQPGQIFGELALVDPGERTHRAEALDNNVLICITARKRFEQFLDEYPEVSRKVYKSLGERMRTVEQKLVDMVFRGSEERILNFLVKIGEENKKIAVDEAYIKPFFTHEEIAYLTATSRQTVTTILNDLRSEDILSYKYNKMYIKNFTALKNKLPDNSVESD